MFRNLGPVELLLIVVILLVLFGGKKIPEMMRGLGRGINEFKKASASGVEDENDATPVQTPKV